MSILGRFLQSGQVGVGGAPEQRSLMSSSFVPPPQVGVIDDFVGVHRAMAHMTVFACVRLLADTIASLPWKAYRRDSSGVPKEVRPQPAIISQPFPGFDLFQWKWMMVASMALRGNSYSYITARDKSGYPTSILPLHPDIVFLERRPDILMWFDPIYRIMGEPVPKEDMIHMRRFTMPGEPWGMSPIRQAAVAIGLGLSAEEYGYRFYKESATPSGTLQTDQDVDAATLQLIQQNWIQSHGGRRLPAVLSKGFKFEPISLRPDESQFLETRQFQRSEICLLFGVPPILIGDTKECVVAGTLVTMADGTRTPVERLIPGDRVTAWDGSKLVASRVSWVGSIPVKPIVKVTTTRGRELTCTADHPMLAATALRTPGNRPLDARGEWIHAGNLKPGHYVRIGLGHLESEVGHLDRKVGYFLGQMIGDGHIRMDGKHYSSWANTDPDVIAEMTAITEGLGGRLAYRGNRSYDILGAGAGSVIGGILRESGLIGTHSYDKFVPDMVMAGGPDAWKGFLTGYMDSDGCVSTTAKHPHAHWGSASRELLDGCQHLLALLGINSSLYLATKAGRRKMPDGRESDCRDHWQLRVKGGAELAKLAQVLYPAHRGKADRLKSLADPCATVRPVVFEYDRVKFVEHLGDGQAVGLEIEETHTHVTNGIITHNTTAWGTGVEQITLGAVTYTFRPWTSCIESVISSCLPRGQFVRFDYNSLLRGDMNGRYAALKEAIQGSFMTPNEARAGEEMDPLANGDALLGPPGFVPLGTTPDGSQVATDKPAEAPHYPTPAVGGGEDGSGNRAANNDPFATYEKEIRLASVIHGKHSDLLDGEELT